MSGAGGDVTWDSDLVRRLSAEIFSKYDGDGDGLLQHKDYESFCVDIWYSLELSGAEYAEQCKGLGCELSVGIDVVAFEALYTEFGRDAVADYALLFPSSEFKKRHSSQLMRFGVLMSHLYA